MPAKKTDEINPALSELINRIRKDLAKAVKVDAGIRHRIGTAVKQVRDRAKYGAGAMKELERAFGFDANTLRRFEAVAETWTRGELRSLLAKKNANGVPLTWSHLEALAEEQVAQRREKFIVKALEKGWSVRDLREALFGTDAAQDESTSTGAQSRYVQLRMFTGRVSSVAKSVSHLDKLLDVDVPTPEYREAVSAASKAYTELRAACDAAIQKLDAKLTITPAELSQGVVPELAQGAAPRLLQPVRTQT